MLVVGERPKVQEGERRKEGEKERRREGEIRCGLGCMRGRIANGGMGAFRERENEGTREKKARTRSVCSVCVDSGWILVYAWKVVKGKVRVRKRKTERKKRKRENARESVCACVHMHD